MAAPSRRFTAQRSGIALAALLVASMSVHDGRVAAALQNGTAANGQAAHLAKVAYSSVVPTIAHHYPG